MNQDLMAAVRELNGIRARALAIGPMRVRRGRDVGVLTVGSLGYLDFQSTGLAAPESPEPEIATCALAVAAEELRHAIEAFAQRGWFSRQESEPDYHEQLERDSKRRD